MTNGYIDKNKPIDLKEKNIKNKTSITDNNIYCNIIRLTIF